MPLIDTQFERQSNLVQWEQAADQGFCRDPIVVNEASEVTYSIGTVLGRVSADGKYKVAVQTATDGSQTPAAVVIREEEVIPAATDTTIPAFVRGGLTLKSAGLKLDPSFNTPALVQAAYDDLEAINGGIIVGETY